MRCQYFTANASTLETNAPAEGDSTLSKRRQVEGGCANKRNNEGGKQARRSDSGRATLFPEWLTSISKLGTKEQMMLPFSSLRRAGHSEPQFSSYCLDSHGVRPLQLTNWFSRKERINQHRGTLGFSSWDAMIAFPEVNSSISRMERRRYRSSRFQTKGRCEGELPTIFIWSQDDGTVIELIGALSVISYSPARKQIT